MNQYIYILFFTIITFTCQAQTRQLVVTSMYGGPMGFGAILATDTNGHNFHPVYTFDGTNGSCPDGRLVMAPNGIIYGVTKFGGVGDSCVIYSYDLAGNTYTLLHDFYETVDSGWWDQSGPVLAADGNLYGLGEYGGRYGGGSIYKLNLISHAYHDIFDFDTATGKVSESGLLQLSNGKLYGMTLQGGMHNRGTMYSFDPASGSFTVLHHFIDSTGSSSGYGSLIKASNNKLYGVTKNGGSHNAGVLFSYDLNSNLYTVEHQFSPFYGANPNNSLAQAANGKLYGLTNDGGAHGQGSIFSFDIPTDSFTDLYDFDVVHGGRPISYLTEASDGSLYATTSEGGAHGGGVVFRYNIDSNAYSVVYDLDSVTAARPAGAVMEVNAQNPVSAIISPVAGTGLQVMPNPTSSSVIIQSSTVVKQVKLTDLTGRECAINTKPISQYIYEADGLNVLSNGIYLLKISDGDRWQTIKLAVQK